MVEIAGERDALEELAHWAAGRGWGEVAVLSSALRLDLGADPASWDDRLRLLQEVMDRAPRANWEMATFRSDAPDRGGCGAGHQTLEIAGRSLRLQARNAFGSGFHPTTAACLDALKGLALSRALEGAAVMDVGTGSGILALAAAAWGAARVVALDIDRDAVREALGNLRANGIGGIHIFCGGLEAVAPTAAFQVVVANLVPAVMAALLPRLATLCHPGGHLLLSGSKAGGYPAPPCFRAVRTWRRDGWLTTLFEKEE